MKREAATHEDIDRMKQIIGESLKAGAIGLSSSRTLLHLSSSGKMYRHLRRRVEMKAWAQPLMARMAMSCSLFPIGKMPRKNLTSCAKPAGKPAPRAHLPSSRLKTQRGMNENPDLWRDQLKRIETAQAEGLDIRGQVISRPIGILMGHIATMSPFYKRPSYVAVADLPPAERAAKLKDPARKAQILAEENDNPHIFVQLLSTNFGAMYPMENPIEYLPQNENSVAARAETEGRDPEEWLYDFWLKTIARI